VHCREGVGVDGQRAVGYLGRLHLIELCDRGHERVPLVVRGLAVVEVVGVNRTAGTLVLGELSERELAPKLAWVKSKLRYSADDGI
jgi:hypothetical protein